MTEGACPNAGTCMRKASSPMRMVTLLVDVSDNLSMTKAFIRFPDSSFCK